MKNRNLFYIFSMISLFVILTSCDTALMDKPVSVIGSEQKVLPRGDCMECPDADECCCSVALQSTNQPANVNICGSTGGLGTCGISEVGICDPADGISYTFTLDDNEPKGIFCSLVEGPLCITNLSSSLIAHVIISCQVGAVNPDTVWLHIPVSSTICFQTDEECELEPCE